MTSRVYCSAQALCVAFAVSLAACGGGGGGNSGSDLFSAPGLTLSPTNVSFTAVHNGATPPTQNVQVTISRPGAVSILVGFPPGVTPPNWLDQSASRFSCTQSLSNCTLVLAITDTTLPAGTYTTTIRFGISDASQNLLALRDVQLSYTVQPLAGFAANPQSLSFSQLKGAAAPAAQNLGISELGGASYAWNASVIYTSGSGWLNINGAASASGATLPTSLSISVNTSGTLGTLNAVVHVAGNGHTLDVPVSYTVSEATLTRSPASLTFNASSQGTAPTNKDVTLSTQGSLPVNYTTSVAYGVGNGWLSVPASGTAPGTVSVGVNTTNLAPGTYDAIVNFRTATQTVSVSVTYAVATSSLTLSPSSVTYTISPTSVASDLNRGITVGTTGTPLTWTAGSFQPWVHVSPPTGSSGTTVTLSVDPTQVDLLEAATHSATVTFNYTMPNVGPASTALAVTLNLQLPKVNYVSPYVELPNTSTEVILRGSGFSNATGLNVMFGATPVSTFTPVSDTEIRVVHPSLPAGSYLITIPNQLNLTRSRASLVVAAAPLVTAASLPTLLEPVRIVYDAERIAAFANNIFNNGGGGGTPRIDRHRLISGGWTTDSLQLPDGSPIDIALTPDGLELIALSPSTLYHIDSATFTISRQLTLSSALPLLPNFATFGNMAMGNDGNALVFVNTPIIKPYLYNVLTRTFTQLANFSNSIGSMIAPVSSMDGSRILIGAFTPNNLFFYDASSAQIALAIPNFVVNRIAYDRTGTISVIDGIAYNRQFQVVGSGGINLSRPAVSPDGTRGYGVSPGENPALLHTFDLTGSGTFTELPTIPLPDMPGERLVVGISSDGRTVFVASDVNFIVQPLP